MPAGRARPEPTRPFGWTGLGEARSAAGTARCTRGTDADHHFGGQRLGFEHPAGRGELLRQVRAQADSLGHMGQLVGERRASPGPGLETARPTAG